MSPATTIKTTTRTITSPMFNVHIFSSQTCLCRCKHLDRGKIKQLTGSIPCRSEKTNSGAMQKALACVQFFICKLQTQEIILKHCHTAYPTNHNLFAVDFSKFLAHQTIVLFAFKMGVANLALAAAHMPPPLRIELATNCSSHGFY